jgi:uncharacterized protein (UPF0332 family)
MSCTPRDLFTLAERLASLEACDEVQYRCVISRAYYAALHTTAQVFPRAHTDLRADGESSHAEIIRHAQVYGVGANPGRESATKIAKALHKLRRFRNTADYELGISITQQETLDTLERVKHILDLCQHVEDRRGGCE